MNEFETGLRHRLRRALRQKAQQHEHLRSLHKRLDDALECGAIDAVRAAAERLHAALAAHFELEDAVIFPAFHGLAHRSARDLNALAQEHRRYLAELERLRAQLDATTLETFEAGYRAFSAAIDDHERREEALLSSLEGATDSPVRSDEPPPQRGQENPMKTLLVPIDFSDHSTRALEAAKQIAKLAGGKIHLLHCYQLNVGGISPYGVTIPDDFNQRIRNAAEEQLTALERAVAADGIAVESHPRLDGPATHPARQRG